jgi:hypothetical protein
MNRRTMNDSVRLQDLTAFAESFRVNVEQHAQGRIALRQSHILAARRV